MGEQHVVWNSMLHPCVKSVFALLYLPQPNAQTFPCVDTAKALPRSLAGAGPLVETPLGTAEGIVAAAGVVPLP